MSKFELCTLTITELAGLIATKKVSPVEVLGTFLQLIAGAGKKLNAYITVMEESALADARQAEKEIISGTYRGVLHGVPIALKDLIKTKGIRTTSGSAILANYVPDEDATVTQRLKQSGAIIIGKTNMHEFGLGVTSENPHYGPALNPWDTQRITGGSSGGSAAAVAASLCSAAIGSDTGGSIRIPASLCGVVGLKPTYGRVSRYGVIPTAWTLDHIGPLCKTAVDAMHVLSAIEGFDPRDHASRSTAPIPAPGSWTDMKGMKVGIIREYFPPWLDSEVNTAVSKAAADLESLGAVLEEVSFPRLEQTYIAVSTIILTEASSYQETRFPDKMAEYGADARTRLEMGRVLLASDYIIAQRTRQLVVEELSRLLERVDILLTPTMPCVAPRLGERAITLGDRVMDTSSAFMSFIALANLAGLPAISVPCGFSSSGLPIGLHMVGRPFAEESLVKAAHLYEVSTEWHKRKPVL